MDRFFLVSLFCAGLFLASGCQRTEPGIQDARVLSGPEAQIVIPARWMKIADFKVEKVAARNSEAHVGIVGVKSETGGVHCHLVQEKPEVTEKWFPLPLKFLSPHQPGKKFSKAFADTLSFSRTAQSEMLFNFLVDFKKDAFQFASLWKVVPYLAKGEKGDYCVARAEICTDFQEDDGKLACKGDWRWLKEIIAVPDVVAYFTGRGEKLVSIKGVFYSEGKDGQVIAGEPVVLK